MDDRLFEEMLQEIEAMTTEEYWSLYREAEKLADFPPEDPSFIPIRLSGSSMMAIYHSFNNTVDTEAISVFQTSYSETILDGDTVWLKVA